MISKYEVGHLCKLESVLGRIVGESEDGSWGFVNNMRVFSIPLFGTPHGSVLKTGIVHLSDLTFEEEIRLRALEEDAKKARQMV